MKTKMTFPIPTMFQVIDRFLASVNRVTIPKRLRAARVAVYDCHVLIRAKRHHWFFSKGVLNAVSGIRAGNLNYHIDALLELYSIMYPARGGNVAAFRRWYKDAEEKRVRSEAIESLGRQARELGYSLDKP